MFDPFYKLDADLCRIKSRVLKPSDKLVYAVIVDRMREKRESWPGERSIAEDTGIDKSTVGISVLRLENAGLLEVAHGRGRHGNRYELPADNVRKIRTLIDSGNVRKIRAECPQNPGGNVREIRTETERTKKQSKARAGKITFDLNTVSLVGISPDDLTRWKADFPQVEIDGEIKGAAEWLLSHPKRRPSDYRMFLRNWFKKAQKWATERGSQEPGPDTEEYWAGKEADLQESFDKTAGYGKYARTTQ